MREEADINITKLLNTATWCFVCWGFESVNIQNYADSLTVNRQLLRYGGVICSSACGKRGLRALTGTGCTFTDLRWQADAKERKRRDCAIIKYDLIVLCMLRFWSVRWYQEESTGWLAFGDEKVEGSLVKEDEMMGLGLTKSMSTSSMPKAACLVSDLGHSVFGTPASSFSEVKCQVVRAVRMHGTDPITCLRLRSSSLIRNWIWNRNILRQHAGDLGGWSNHQAIYGQVICII